MSSTLEDAPLFKCLRKKRGWLKAKSDRVRETTHTMQTGGCLSVPHGELKELYDVLQEELIRESQGKPSQFFLNELHSSVFPMYYDIDLKNERPEIYPDIWCRLIAVLRENVRLFFSEAAAQRHPRLFDAIVCSINGTNLSGIHVYMPNLLVDADKARIIRYSLVCQLIHVARDLVSGGWESIVDEQVYSTGLRMPGSKKLEQCRVCLGHTGSISANCAGHCDANGRQCVGRQYRFAYFFSDVQDAQSDRFRVCYAENWASLLEATSIRRDANTTVSEGFELYRGCPTPLDARLKKPRPCKSKTELERSHPAYPAMERQIRRTNPHYRDLDVYRILMERNLKTNRDHSAIVDVVGRNATYCLNKGDFHRSSRVWFYVTENYIQVRCRCKKPSEGRRSAIPCAKFRSLTMPLDVTLRDLLFPEAKKNNAARNSYGAFYYTAPVTPAMTPGSVTLLQRISRNSEPMTQITTPRAVDYYDEYDDDENCEHGDASLTRSYSTSEGGIRRMSDTRLGSFNVAQHAQLLDRELTLLEASMKPLKSARTTTRKHPTSHH